MEASVLVDGLEQERISCKELLRNLVEMAIKGGDVQYGLAPHIRSKQAGPGDEFWGEMIEGARFCGLV